MSRSRPISFPSAPIRGPQTVPPPPPGRPPETPPRPPSPPSQPPDTPPVTPVVPPISSPSASPQSPPAQPSANAEKQGPSLSEMVVQSEMVNEDIDRLMENWSSEIYNLEKQFKESRAVTNYETQRREKAEADKAQAEEKVIELEREATMNATKYTEQDQSLKSKVKQLALVQKKRSDAESALTALRKTADENKRKLIVRESRILELEQMLKTSNEERSGWEERATWAEEKIRLTFERMTERKAKMEKEKEELSRKRKAAREDREEVESGERAAGEPKRLCSPRSCWDGKVGSKDVVIVT